MLLLLEVGSAARKNKVMKEVVPVFLGLGLC